MKVPCCSICQTRYNEEDRVPLLLQCGHGFCKDCLSKLFSSSSSDTSLSCPRCRHVSVVGNSIDGLRKNYALLSLLSSAGNFDCDCTDEEEDEESDTDEERERDGAHPSSSRGLMEIGAHREVKLLKKIGEGSRAGVDTWQAMIDRRRVVVKKVEIVEGMDVECVKGEVEKLRRDTIWCRNVCVLHGVVEVDDGRCLGIVMDRYRGSIRSEMQRNQGRLTLEQILRFGADIARGVAELHAVGVVCMSIKPSNILLDSSGCAVVSDYGLAAILKKPACRKAQLECDSVKSHSCMDCMMLNPHYTAPEAWELAKKHLNLFRDDAVRASPKSDAWSFGCTLVEMCTGSIPWAGLSAEEIYGSILKVRKPPPQYSSVVGAGIPRDLWNMIGDCLQFKAFKRPSFNDMLRIFLRHLQELPRSLPVTPDNNFAKHSGSDVLDKDPSPTPNLQIPQDNTSHLHQLISEGNVNGVRDVLAKAAAGNNGWVVATLLEAKNVDGQTALHLACKRGSAELVGVILAYEQADVDVLDKDGDPPLLFALAAGSPDCVRALIERGANVSHRLRDDFGPTLAHVCACYGEPDCMLELLSAGADPNAIDEEGESVLHRAVAKKYTDCALVILENGGCGSMSVANSKNLTPLHLCVATWNVAVVKRWIEVAYPEQIAEAINIPSPIGTALCMAASLKKDHESEGRELVRLLLAYGADPTAQDAQHEQTALHIASWADDAELVKIILDAGVDVNTRDANNATPLHIALERGAKLCVSLLLFAGANCNLQDDKGDNAFHIAAYAAKMIRENLEWLIAMLENPDAYVEARNYSGKTLCDYLEALPREWISEDLLEALASRGCYLSPTKFEVCDWVKFKRSIATPTHGWQGANHKSIGFVQSVQDKDNLVVSFCTGQTRVLANEVLKVIPLDRGQHVQLKRDIKEPRFGWRGQSRDDIGTVLCVDDDGILRVGFPGASRGWKADPSEMERVEEFKVGDWVRIRPALTTAKHGFGAVTPGSIGIVYSIRPDSSLLLELNYLPCKWHCEPEEVEPVAPFKIGDQVCVKRSVAEPRYAWGGETHHSVGTISEIESNGLLTIEISNRSTPWQADPSDMEKVEDFMVGNWVRVKASVSSPKYGWEDITRNSIGIIHSLEEDGDMGIAFCFRSKPFRCSVTDMEKVPPFEVEQEIRVMPSIIEPRLGWSNESPATVGKVVRIDLDGALSVKVAGRQILWKVSPGDAERLSGFEVGDWVRSKSNLGTRLSYDWSTLGKESLAVVHSIEESGYLELASCFRKSKWSTHYTDVEKVPCFKVGQQVRFRRGLVEPRWGWRGTHQDSKGIIAGVHGDGEVRVAFSSFLGLWRGDPADLEVEPTFEVGEWVRLKEDAGIWKSIRRGSIGVVHRIGSEEDAWDQSTCVSFCGEQERWMGTTSHLERVKRFVVGQKVRVKLSVKTPRFGWSNHSHAYVGTISAIDADGKLKIYSAQGSKSWMLDPAEVELVEEQELCIGDWVRVRQSISNPMHQWGEVNHASIGVVHRMEDDELLVAFCFMERLWLCKAYEMERVRPLRIGDKVRIKEGLATPRWGWGMETHASKGQVVGVDANGKLRIKFKWREGRPWIGDPADIVLDES